MKQFNHKGISRQVANEGGALYMNKRWDFSAEYALLREDARDAGLTNVLPFINRCAQYAEESVGKVPKRAVRVYSRALESKFLLRYFIDNRINCDYRNMNTSMVTQMVPKMLEIRGPKSICTNLSHVSKFYEHLIVEGEVTENPIQRRHFPKWVRKRQPTIMPDACMRYARQLFALGTHDGQTYGMAVAMTANTGLRAQDVWGLKVDSFVADDERLGAHLRVESKLSQWRTVPLTPSFAKLLAAYIAQFCSAATDFMFHEPQGGGFPLIFNRFKKATDAVWKASKGELARYGVTAARRGYATMLFARGMSVDQIRVLYDHSNTRLTLMYIDREEAVQMAEVDKHHPMFAELGNMAKDHAQSQEGPRGGVGVAKAPQAARGRNTAEVPASLAFLADTQYDGPDGKTRGALGKIMRPLYKGPRKSPHKGKKDGGTRRATCVPPAMAG